MRKFALLLLVSVLGFTSCKKEEPKVTELKLGDFTLSSEHFTAGESVDIKYNGADKKVEALYYYMVNYMIYPVDINLSKDQTASLKLPDSAQAIAFNFIIDGKAENNAKKGYLFPLYNKDGKIIPGSKAALAYYTLNYGERNGIAVNKELLIKEIEDDLKQHPELKDTWNKAYLSSLYRADKNKGKKLIKESLNNLLDKDPLTEEDYSTIISYYNLLRDARSSDSIKKIAIAKFPDGSIAKSNYYTLFSREKDLKKKEKIFSEFLKKYKDPGVAENYMARTLAMEYFKKGDPDSFDKYANTIKDKEFRASLYNSAAWPLAEKGKDLDFAAKISKSSLDLLKSEENEMTSKPDFYSVNQYKKNLSQSYNMYADTYAFILFKQGKIEEALTYQEQAVGDGKSNDVNERYIEFLVANKKYKKAKEKAEEFIRNGVATQKTKDLYKTAFLKVNPNEKEYKTQIAALEKVSHEKQMEEIKNKMIDERSFDFTLKDLEGKNVSLASLKGKIVILDFWATWCGPCKASFPGMQKVITKYKNDPNIAILFVDTFERGKDRIKKVSDFISKNKYTFHVVFDNQIKDSNDFEVAPKYGITGIPTKIIIGPDGNVKFRAVGYSGNVDKLVSEMDMMIELLKS